MIYTARQLQDLHKTNGHVTLPWGSRLTPLASDWLRQKRVKVQYGDAPTAAKPQAAAASASTESTPPTAGKFYWWCDGPCGPAKAAVTAVAREADLEPMEIGIDARRITGVIKLLAREVREGRAAGGVLLVESGAAAMVYANRCPSLRAVLGTCRQSVEEGVKLVAANVLIVEHPHQTLAQLKNLLGVFVRQSAGRHPSDDVQRQLQELSSCA